jgi:hypothetical protein
MTNVAGGCWAHLDVLDLDRDELVKALLESARLCGNDGEQGGVRGRGVRQNACVRENKRQAAGSVAEQRARLGETKERCTYRNTGHGASLRHRGILRVWWVGDSAHVSGSEQSHTHAYTPTHRVFDRHRLMQRGAHKTKQKTANRRASSDADFTMMCVVATEVPTPYTQPTAELLAGNRGHSKSAPTPAWALSHKPSARVHAGLGGRSKRAGRGNQQYGTNSIQGGGAVKGGTERLRTSTGRATRLRRRSAMVAIGQKVKGKRELVNCQAAVLFV